MRTIFNTMLFSAASVTLTAGLVAYADPSVASVPQPVTAQVRVAYRDLDLRSDAGRSVLDQRIRTAAEQACTTGAMSDLFERGACRKQAIQTAYRELDARTAGTGAPAAAR